MPGLRPLDAGSLSQAAAIEAFTAVCITLNIRHKAHSTLGWPGSDCRSDGRLLVMRLFDTARGEVVPFEPRPPW